ncbi:MAG: hypothetical protein OEZ01_07990 [Candidatus Heimdallarchaeota archaeon]|nr:hypothetical protein [Candidatus Heimdallarchaeota archaeon]MDH5645933.1 hypothetical protein [Candidatus Heimdallarchaeota archaeon]
MTVQNQAKILIAGGGSIGSVIGVMLQKQGYNPWILRRSPPFGTVSLKVQGQLNETIEVQIVSTDHLIETKYEPQIVIITVQEQHTEEIIIQLSSIITSNTILISLQNGLRSGEILLKHFPNNPVFQGTIWWSAALINNEEVYYHRTAETRIGIPPRSIATRSMIEPVIQMFHQTLDINFIEDLSLELMRKLCLNVVSPVLALIKQPYPQGMRDNVIIWLIHILFDEAILYSGYPTSEIMDIRLTKFHDNLVTMKKYPTEHNLHKVSTQLGIEKYGGSRSNVDELLDYFVQKGAIYAKIVRDIVVELPTTYEALTLENLTLFIQNEIPYNCKL